MKKRLVVGITGATGAAYGVRLLEELRSLRGWESHLVLSEAGVLNAWQELGMKRKDIERLAHRAYAPKDIGATIASGSFLTEGMVIAPWSMKTLAAVAHAHAGDLVARAADVTLKERRRLVLLPRETPLNLAHLRNMVAVTTCERSSCSRPSRNFQSLRYNGSAAVSNDPCGVPSFMRWIKAAVCNGDASVPNTASVTTAAYRVPGSSVCPGTGIIPSK